MNFIGRFILNLATTSEPLGKLTRNNIPFKWEHENIKAFEELKKQLAQPETLGYFYPSAQTIVETDASPVALVCVLLRKQRSEYRVIMYASKSLSDVERRYSQTEKKALEIVWGCERFHMYLMGSKFELLTDYRTFEAFSQVQAEYHY